MMTEMHHIGTLRYIYDPNDERIATIDMVGSVERSRLYTLRGSDNKVARELRRAGSTWTRGNDYVCRDGVLLATFSAGNDGNFPDPHFHVDHLGSTRVVTDANGRSVRTSWPFGDEALGSQTDRTTSLKFTGHERDTNSEALTMDYMHARYYGPVMARFLSVDRASAIPAIPQSWNRYAYVRNSPLDFVVSDRNEPLNVHMRQFLEAFLHADLLRVDVYGDWFAHALTRIAGADGNYVWPEHLLQPVMVRRVQEPQPRRHHSDGSRGDTHDAIRIAGLLRVLAKLLGRLYCESKGWNVI